MYLYYITIYNIYLYIIYIYCIGNINNTNDINNNNTYNTQTTDKFIGPSYKNTVTLKPNVGTVTTIMINPINNNLYIGSQMNVITEYIGKKDIYIYMYIYI